MMSDGWAMIVGFIIAVATIPLGLHPVFTVPVWVGAFMLLTNRRGG